MSDKNTNVTCTDNDLGHSLDQGKKVIGMTGNDAYYIGKAIIYSGYMIAKALCSIATAIKESKK